MQIKLNSFERLLSAVIISLVCSTKLLMAQSVPTPPANQLVIPFETFTISFHWQGDSIYAKQRDTILSKWEANIAILIPIKLRDC
uniref:hypothetical protein n=1 Tax=Pedobacter nyackensis TaxID=475255 RepID=UPI00292F69A9